MYRKSIFPPLALRGAARVALLSSLLGATLLTASALAQDVPGPNAAGRAPVAHSTGLAQRCREAQLIFEGVVESIRVRSSDVRHAGDVCVPHTFVTFRVERVYKGGIAGSQDGTLTLRFLGGTDAGGRTLTVSHAPRFEVGSREVLLVRNSQSWGIPLVHGELRRFKMVEGRVLGEGGQALELAGGELHVRSLAERGAKRNERDVRPQPAHSMPTDVFRSTLENLIRQTHDAQDFFATAPVSTVAFEAPFFTPAPIERAPQVRAADLAAPIPHPESQR